MRTAFFETLIELAAVDDRIELVVADLGFGAVEEFAGRYPDRFLNVGVAEQNMTGVATGLALTGSRVFTYSIANFPTLRCLEQVRNDVCYHHADVKIVSVGGGLGYGPLGFTHHASEDLAILRALPGLAVAAPGDPFEAAALAHTMGTTPGPAYLRLNRNGEPRVHAGPISLPPGKSITLAEGGDLSIIVTGSLLATALDAASILSKSGLSVRVVSMPWLAPLDVDTILNAAGTTSLVVTLEEHSVTGGLGGAVAEVVSGMDERCPVMRLGLPSTFISEVGTQEHLRAVLGLDPVSVARRVLDRIDSLAGRPVGSERSR